MTEPAPGLSFSLHDDELPADAAAVVDTGLGEANEAAAPLREVRRLACFVRDGGGAVIGGAVGRTWGACCELQQLWVAPAHRRGGLGAELVRRFEARALGRGCSHFYLETFSFQAPSLYRALGYDAVHRDAAFPHGIVKFLMSKDALPPAPPRADAVACGASVGFLHDPTPTAARDWAAALAGHARVSGLSLLVLDTEAASPAEGIYRHLGWRYEGSIPGQALTPDGAPHATVYLYRMLS